jgi:hypothetical protein
MRPGCGTLAGMLAHQSAGEPACGTCTLADAKARIEAEGIPSRPSPPGWLPPVTAEQAALNAAVLDAEVAIYDADYRAAAGDRPAGRRHLRAVS